MPPVYLMDEIETEFGIEKPFKGIPDRAPIFCEGLPEEPYCGDEIDPDQKYCKGCQRQVDRLEELQAWAEDDPKFEPLVSYPHLTDEEEHLR